MFAAQLSVLLAHVTHLFFQSKCRTITLNRKIYRHFTDSSTGNHSGLFVRVFLSACRFTPRNCAALELAGSKMEDRLIASKWERVNSQMRLVSGSTPGRSVFIVGRKSIARCLYFTEQFHPVCTREGLSSESRLAFKCGKSAQSPPLTRNAARLSSWCSLNKLNNEGISEMPKRHYTPTIRARSE